MQEIREENVLYTYTYDIVIYFVNSTISDLSISNYVQNLYNKIQQKRVI